MRIARNYLGREIYQSSAMVTTALLGLFAFFALIDDLDKVSDTFGLGALLYLEVLAIPTRLYDLLPIGLLIGSILALASLAQRNELTILRVSGVSGMRLLATLWLIVVPIMAGALVLSEWLTPLSEIKSGEANLTLRGKSGGARMSSGYWFKEPTPNGGTRILNIHSLQSGGSVSGVTLYEFDDGQELIAMSTAPEGHFRDETLVLDNVTTNRLKPQALGMLADPEARHPAEPLMQVERQPERTLDTTLTPARLLARVLTPERMSLATLLDYIDYLNDNQIQADRQIVAMWRKLAYPFTLLVMITIAAPIGFMQTRRGGVAAKVFIGILLGVGFFMLNQLALNVGMLGRWPAWVTALMPSLGALVLALGTLLYMEYRHAVSRIMQHRWPWRKSPA